MTIIDSPQSAIMLFLLIGLILWFIVTRPTTLIWLTELFLDAYAIDDSKTYASTSAYAVNKAVKRDGTIIYTIHRFDGGPDLYLYNRNGDCTMSHEYEP